MSPASKPSAALSELLKAAQAFLRGADRGHVSVGADRALRAAIAKAVGAERVHDNPDDSSGLIKELQADHAEYLSGKVLMSQEAFDELQKGREGWVLVPRVPTVEMIVAATEEWLCIAAMEDRAETIWEAMLSASPEAGGGG